MAKNAQLKFNDTAPDLELLDTEGTPVQLSALWKKQVLVLAFTRHFGCPQCKEMVDTLANAAPEIKSNGLELAFVAQGSQQETKTFCEARAPGQLCLADPEREAYRAYGLERANVWQTFLSWRVWQSNKRLKQEHGWNTELPPPGRMPCNWPGRLLSVRMAASVCRTTTITSPITRLWTCCSTA